MSITPTQISSDDFARLTALLDVRRRIVANHTRSRRLLGRAKLTLAEKLAIDREQKAELAELNQRIDQLMNQGGDQ